MRVSETNISGLLIINGLKFPDNRGALIKPFSQSFFNNQEINLNFKETWFTQSNKNVVRAMHLQLGSLPCEKLVSVISGAVLDVILDLRKDSETYGCCFDIELNDEESTSLYIPVGCAHGYKVLRDNTITMYMSTEVHSAVDDIGIKWNSFGYDWGIDDPIISDRDNELPHFEDY